MSEPIEELIEKYREEKGDTNNGRWKPFKAQRINCEAVDLAGNPVEGDCIECVSHSKCRGGNGKYRQMKIGGIEIALHRLSWEVNNGRIPEGYEVDHLCRNPKCINPKHLQLLSPESNRLKMMVENGKLLSKDLLVLKGPELCQVWARGSFEKPGPEPILRPQR